MPKFPSSRPTLLVRADGTKSLYTRNLGDLRTKLGPKVLNAFIRAFALVDRLDSLVAFEHLNLKALKERPEQRDRNHFTFVAFTMGTMFELSNVICNLRDVLISGKIVTPKEWEALLPGWDKRWRSNELCADFRNNVSFHVNKEWIDKGLDRMVKKAKKAEIFRSGSSGKRQDNVFVLGPSAILEGFGLSLKEMSDLASKPIDDLDVNVGRPRFSWTLKGRR